MQDVVIAGAEGLLHIGDAEILVENQFGVKQGF